MLEPIHIIGASGRSGQALCRALLARGTPYTPVIRDSQRWSTTNLPGKPIIADLTDHTLEAALQTATTIVSCAHARHIPAVLRATASASHFVFLGSTRKFTRWPDAHGNGVLAGETALLASGRPGILLHPTMIYGAEGEDNVRRLAALLRRLPIVPLPGGGKALVQPIHQSDVTACILAALDHPAAKPETLVIAGPAPLSYADFARAIARAAGLHPPRIVSVPPSLLHLAAPLARLAFLPRIGADEIRRLLEDKAFDIAPMEARLRVTPITLAAGLALTFRTPPPCP